jgi:glycosyltransferase involved in cell wall biosynthesis
VGALVRAATFARNLLMRDADAFVAMSEAIRREFVAAGVSPERIAHLPHGVDTRRFRPAEAGERSRLRWLLGRGESEVVFCYTGRLLRGKGLETLLSAFGEVARESPEAHLVIVGSGEGQALSVEGALRDEVRRSGLQARVTFAGRRDDVEECLRAADVFVFPSLNEALGISLVEAAACGLPAVASRTGGIVDVVRDGNTGLLVDPGDAPGLAAAMRRLLGDASQRQALGAAARERAVARFDFDASVAQYRALFAEVAR